MTAMHFHSHSKFAWAALVLSFLIYPILLTRYIFDNSAAFDEPEHIAAGYRYWQCADYGINPEHPPLLKLVAAFPIRHWQIGGFDSPCGTKLTSNEELIGDGYRLINTADGIKILSRARRATFIFPLLLLATVFFFTKDLFGPLAAGIAAVLTLFEPNLTAFGPLVLTDVAVTATTLLALAVGWSFARKPTLIRTLLLGLALGLALASKHSAAVVPFILLLEFVVSGSLQRHRTGAPSFLRLVFGWIVACALAVVVLWATYQFRFEAVPGAPNSEQQIAKELQANREEKSLFGRGLLFVTHHHLLPESYIAGLVYVRTHSTRPAYLFGRRLESGVWYYFPVAITIKTPLPILLLALVCVCSKGIWIRWPQQVIWLTLPAGIFLAAAMATKMNIGIRHILPIYPLLIILASAAAAYWAPRSRATAVACAALLAFQAVSYARSFPNEVTYANELWGGPRQLHRYLGDSNVDVGQSLYRVREYIQAHHIGNCWIAWFGMQKPELANLPCKPLPTAAFLEATDTQLPPVAGDSFSGDVFVSATLTDYDVFPYRAFAELKPFDTIDGSVLVYRGDFVMPQLAAERRVARAWWLLNHAQPAEAIVELRAAEGHAASPGMVHSFLGWALQWDGQTQEALLEYEQAAQDFQGPANKEARNSALRAAEELRKQLGK